MPRSKSRATLPEGEDWLIPLDRVRHGMWVQDPETGQFVQVKEIRKNTGGVCSWSRKPITHYELSLRKVGLRELPIDSYVTVRVTPEVLGALT